MTRAFEPTGRSRTGATDVIVIGAGHSGLAVSHFLTAFSIDHVILERGEVANSWRHERWDSLRLLTPNWLSRLPGHGYTGRQPDEYMSSAEVTAFISDYASKASAPVQARTNVTRVVRTDSGYRVSTDRGAWTCRALVVASGACNLPVVPAVSAALPEGIAQLTAMDYKNPQQLGPGGVLVVGASATGLQLADEIRRAGHEVTIAVGEHVRLPRSYRGRDIQWWMHVTGVLDQKYTEVDDLTRARNVPSPQLVGSNERPFMDLNLLADQGVRIAGRLAGVRNGIAQFSGSLRNVCALADLKMNRLLTAVDNWLEQKGCPNFGTPAERFEPTRAPAAACLNLDLKGGAIRTVLWATGYRPDYSWLDVPVLDRKGFIRHEGGIGAVPGLYVTGLPFLRRRKSSFIHGAEDDARELAEHLAAWLAGTRRKPLSRVAS